MQRSTQLLQALKSGLKSRVALKEDKDLLAKIFNERILKDPHYKSAGCTSSDMKPVINYKVNHALKYNLSLIVEDEKQKPQGYTVVTVANRNPAYDLNKDLQRPSVNSKDTSYHYISRLYRFCKMHFWTILPPMYEKVAIIESVNIKWTDKMGLGDLLKEAVETVENSDPTIEGIACIATSDDLLEGLREAGFMLMFSVPKDLYYMADQTNWTPKDDLHRAQMMFRPFNDVVTEKLKSEVTVGKDWEYTPHQ